MRPSLQFVYNTDFDFVMHCFVLVLMMEINSENVCLLIFKFMCFLLSKLEIEFVYNISYICAKIKFHWIKEHNNLEYGGIWNCITRSQFKQKKN